MSYTSTCCLLPRLVSSVNCMLLVGISGGDDSIGGSGCDVVGESSGDRVNRFILGGGTVATESNNMYN